MNTELNVYEMQWQATICKTNNFWLVYEEWRDKHGPSTFQSFLLLCRW